MKGRFYHFLFEMYDLGHENSLKDVEIITIGFKKCFLQCNLFLLSLRVNDLKDRKEKKSLNHVISLVPF